MSAPIPKLSVVIPVYNEEQVLPQPVRAAVPGARRARHQPTSACSSTTAARTARRRCCGSSFSARPRETRVVLFHANFGQHSAIMAGLAYARGEYVRDARRRPAESARGDRQAVAKLDQGYDYVGTIRQQRQDMLWRRMLPRRIMNAMREWITPVSITDQGCMMRGYARSVVTRSIRRAKSTPSFRRWPRCTR